MARAGLTDGFFHRLWRTSWPVEPRVELARKTLNLSRRCGYEYYQWLARAGCGETGCYQFGGAVADADFETLIERHYPRIRRAAMLLSGNVVEAEDLAQETFLQAMQSWRRRNGNGQVETWLYAILVNLDRKRRRGHVRRWRRVKAWFAARSATEPAAPEARIEMTEWHDSLWAHVATLPAPQHRAVVLRYAEGLSLTEISEALDCPLGTVKSRLHHALATLEQKLGCEWRPSAARVSCGDET